MTPPNPRLQRTRFAPLRSPLSRKSFGDPEEGIVRHRVWRMMCVGMTSGILLALSCSSSQKPPETLSRTTSNIPEEAIGQQFGVASLTTPARDATYGYSEKSPVVVGGGFGEGSHNTYRFLNALLGPAGQPVHYTRIGTCCPFKTPNSPFDGEGILEVYEISFAGGKPSHLYFNWYDSETLYIPRGLTARGR